MRSLDPLIESWDIDLETFALEIVLNHTVVPGQARRFEFVEREAGQPSAPNRGSRRFCGIPPSAAPRRGGGRVPEAAEVHAPAADALYYYRELQSLRDPLHFVTA